MWRQYFVIVNSRRMSYRHSLYWHSSVGVIFSKGNFFSSLNNQPHLQLLPKYSLIWGWYNINYKIKIEVTCIIYYKAILHNIKINYWCLWRRLIRLHIDSSKYTSLGKGNYVWISIIVKLKINCCECCMNSARLHFIAYLNIRLKRHGKWPPMMRWMSNNIQILKLLVYRLEEDKQCLWYNYFYYFS